MSALPTANPAPSREQLLHSLYEAAELEHCLMCTYLYAAFSLKRTVGDGVTEEQCAAIARWRSVITNVAIEEMGHLVAVWNITSALGGAPRIGRQNFPLDPGTLPAGVVVKLAPFNEATLQHFIFLERPAQSDEPEGQGFAPERQFLRAVAGTRLVPMPLDYDTVGTFYEAMSAAIRAFVEVHGEAAAFCGEPGLQFASSDTPLRGVSRVLCAKTALAAFDAIVAQGEGAPQHSQGSHYQKFAEIRSEYRELLGRDPGFVPAFPAATNPVLRRPPRPEGRVWIEDEDAVACVDLGNAAYGLMLRLLATAYAIKAPAPEKALAIECATGLMHALVPIAEHAARLPAGPANPNCHAGVTFITLRDAASLPPGMAARRFFLERLDELASAAERVAERLGNPVAAAAPIIRQLEKRARRAFEVAGNVVAAPTASATSALAQAAPSTPAAPKTGVIPVPVVENGVERIPGEKLTLVYEGKRCIHARFCVTRAPMVFLANVKGPWIFPDAMSVEGLTEIAHDCPSGAIRYERRDGQPNEAPPPVNLAEIREAGPYGLRAALVLDGEAIGYRATLCRCGASKNKPFCDGSHHEIGFSASGEPATGAADALASRDGPLLVDPQINGPLWIRGNLEITSGTGRVVARTSDTRLCRCGGSATKPFCDGTHARIGFVAP
jgi:CDGSH-type Zn-finger protein/uncharacterized Fe-S cluster protein YjdI